MEESRRGAVRARVRGEIPHRGNLDQIENRKPQANTRGSVRTDDKPQAQGGGGRSGLGLGDGRAHHTQLRWPL